MNLSFYSAAVGAGTQQEKLNVIANNMANINNNGYKAQAVVFSDLLYNNMNAPETENSNMKVGCGTRVEKTDINFEQSGFQATDMPYDYAIMGDGFFAMYNPVTEETTYTRNGNFTKSLFEDEEFYLVNNKGLQVLGSDMEPIVLTEDDGEKPLDIGIYTFNNQEGFLCIGDDEFVPVNRNGNIFQNDSAILKKGHLESSNVDMSLEMSRVIEAQRAYQLSLKMIQTSDEIEQTINGLR